jgi:hypothetical protein
MLETIKSPNWHLLNYFFSSCSVRDSGMEVIVVVVVESGFYICRKGIKVFWFLS